MPSSVVSALVTLTRQVSGDAAGAVEVLAERTHGTVVRVGPVVAKAHSPGTDQPLLATRLRIAAALPEFLSPLPVPRPVVAPFLTVIGDHPVSVWPAGEHVDASEPDATPWRAAAALLAQLHRRSIPPAAPRAGGPGRVGQALAALPASAAGWEASVRAAAATLPAWARGESDPPAPQFLIHGDWHLGQLVSTAAGWRLLDVDDLGVGPAAWDLARPAGWFLSGLLGEAEWGLFLSAYREHNGPAIAPGRNPWDTLDVPARALTVQHAAEAVARAASTVRPPDEVDLALVDACRRMARL